DRELAGTGLGLPPRRPDSTHVYHLYVVRSERRDALRAYLTEQGVGTMIHYPVPIHQQPAYDDRLPADDLSETEAAAQQILSLPMYPELTEADARTVVQAIKGFQERA